MGESFKESKKFKSENMRQKQIPILGVLEYAIPAEANKPRWPTRNIYESEIFCLPPQNQVKVES